MQRKQAEKIIAEYIKPIMGFCVKRCKKAADAEDLAQEIAIKAFRGLILREDIIDHSRFIWAIAHNALANYYRDGKRAYHGVSTESAETYFAVAENAETQLLEKEYVEKLHDEIAKLSQIQRKIVVAYYYENKKQETIAKELGIAVSAVKWHLFDSKKNLKKGMEEMRTTQLKFNPVRFSLMGFNGSAGTMGGTQAFFRGALAQNIAYCVYREAKTVRQIAETLGVSPVYVESEAAHLEEYGYLLKKDGKYLANILIDEGDEKLLLAHEKLYTRVTRVFANELFDALKQSGLLQSKSLECRWRTDENYLLWALIPFVAALCDDGEFEEKIRFEEVATSRPDGGYDIANATIETEASYTRLASIKKWCGPSWTSDKNRQLWCCRSEWGTEKDMREFWDYVSPKSIRLLCRMKSGEVLSVDEYSFLAEQGLIARVNGEWVVQVVWLEDAEIKMKLLQIGKQVKDGHRAEFEVWKKTFVRGVLQATPKHLRKAQAYGLQYLFRSDGWFLLHCLQELLRVGKLRLPTEEQKKSLLTVVSVFP